MSTTTFAIHPIQFTHDSGTQLDAVAVAETRPRTEFLAGKRGLEVIGPIYDAYGVVATGDELPGQPQPPGKSGPTDAAAEETYGECISPGPAHTRLAQTAVAVTTGPAGVPTTT